MAQFSLEWSPDAQCGYKPATGRVFDGKKTNTLLCTNHRLNFFSAIYGVLFALECQWQGSPPQIPH